jgi:hypothetical protein
VQTRKKDAGDGVPPRRRGLGHLFGWRIKERAPPKGKALACGCAPFAGSTFFHAFSEKDVDGRDKPRN